MEFGKNLERLRKDAKLSQTELAEKIGLTQQVVSGYEKGKSYPNLEVLCKIADTFHVSVDSLLDHYVVEEDNKMEMRLLSYFKKLSKKDQEKCCIIVQTIMEDRL